MSRLFAIALLPCVLLLSSCQKAEETKPNDENAAPQAQQGELKKGESIIGKVTAQVVDAKKALAENPDLREFERQGLGGDYLTQLANARTYLPAEVQMNNMKHQLDILEADKGRKLSYEEFMDFVKENGFTFSMVKPWQMYGYDSDTGEMMILQDEAKKKRIYEEKGLEYKEGTL